VGDGGADLGPAVLEHQDVVDVVMATEDGGAVGPQLDHLEGAVDAEGRERGVVVAGVEHDLGPLGG
jgi:hypothetical protein